MKLLLEQEISMQLASEATESESPQSYITIEGKISSSTIDGELCEACIKYDSNYLVITTNNCPYEESLNISYLSSDLNLVDKAILVWPYNTGSFSLEKLIEPNRVEFKFFNDSIWAIDVYKNKRAMIPFFSEPRGVWRSFKLSHYFRVFKR